MTPREIYESNSKVASGTPSPLVDPRLPDDARLRARVEPGRTPTAGATYREGAGVGRPVPPAVGPNAQRSPISTTAARIGGALFLLGLLVVMGALYMAATGSRWWAWGGVLWLGALVSMLAANALRGGDGDE
jgi:hypothetical protein